MSFDLSYIGRSATLKNNMIEFIVIITGINYRSRLRYQCLTQYYKNV